MNNREIMGSLKRSIDLAPSVAFEDLARNTMPKMPAHDSITTQTVDLPVPVKRSRNWAPALSLAAMLIVFVSGWAIEYRFPDTIITLDVNPSIEISLNKQHEVLSVKALNDDAEKIILTIDEENNDLEITCQELINVMIDEEYLTETKNVVLATVENNNIEKATKTAEEVADIIQNSLISKNISPVIILQHDKINQDDRDFAAEYGVSSGKIRLIKEISTEDQSKSIKELSQMSVTDLYHLMKQDVQDDIDEDSEDLNEAAESNESENSIESDDGNYGVTVENDQMEEQKSEIYDDMEEYEENENDSVIRIDDLEDTAEGDREETVD